MSPEQLVQAIACLDRIIAATEANLPRLRALAERQPRGLAVVDFRELVNEAEDRLARARGRRERLLPHRVD